MLYPTYPLKLNQCFLLDRLLLLLLLLLVTRLVSWDCWKRVLAIACVCPVLWRGRGCLVLLGH